VNRWSKDGIAIEILRLYSANQPLSYGDVQKSHLRLLRAATRHFGSWKTAVEYAGLDYDRIRRYKVWTRERIIEQIQLYCRQGKDLAWRHVSTQLDPPLAAAAIRPHRFGSWRAALEAAGLDYEDIRRHRSWDDARILAELRRLHEIGASLRVSDACEHSASLVAAARRRFGGWYEAVEAAGLDEMQARRGLGDEWDEDTAEGEISWAVQRGVAR
jgi:HNH endonuclease